MRWRRRSTVMGWKPQWSMKDQLKAWLTTDEVAARVIGIQAAFPQEETEALVIEINKAYASRSL